MKNTSFADIAKYLNKADKQVPTEKEDTIETFCASMIEAIKLFSKEDYQNTLVIFVVQEGEKNIYDQRAVENELWNKYKVKSRRLTLNEIAKNCSTDEQSNILLDGKKISLFYFRACYTEKDYKDEESWKGRVI